MIFLRKGSCRAVKAVIAHLGLFFDDIRDINFLRNRDWLLVVHKGRTYGEFKDLSTCIIRYIAQFLYLNGARKLD